MNHALLLSGGVDSAVAAYQLHKQGIAPDCFYIKIAPQDSTEWDCSIQEDLEMASAVARKYHFPLNVVDCQQEYFEKVTKYTIDKVKNGLTPNPDVMCNRLIKFGAFHDKVGKNYDYIATGHYAQTEIINGQKWLTTSPDPVKDQTDFLAQIYNWQLQKAIFPIGHYTKEQVREIAQQEHLINAKRKDSQGICFLGKINYNDYIRRYLGEHPGDVVEYETGRLIGKHKGLWFHTIGQRHGLGFGGGPWFVVKKNILTNTLFVSKGYNPENAYTKDFLIKDLHTLTVSPFTATNSPTNNLVEAPYTVPVTFKIRHTSEYHKAMLSDRKDGTYLVQSEKKIHGVAPGQFCVLYDEHHHKCYGSGEITL
ncbi:MAG: tRNA 2-thiouridine(34) synthase MnmA [Bacteroidaceae bacterium]|nr:tRNA 2-thiouridine(34) synthase MnmA [Bacteroidaceae bacterium]